MRRLVHVAVAALLAGALLGCAVRTPYQRPNVALPAQWQGQADAVPEVAREVAPDVPGAVASAVTSSTAPAPVTLAWDQWWPAFGSDELNRLADAAVAGNHELAAAQHRVAQARALVAATRASLAPRLDARADSARTQRRGSSTEALHELGVTTSFDPDLSGANRNAVDAATGRVRQREYARESLGAVLLVELCDQYFRALSASDRLAIARANIANAESLLSLLVSRQQAGALSGLEVLRQQGLLASHRATVPALEQQRKSALAALAVLTGQAPQGFAIHATSLTALRLPSLAAALPTELIERHPDVRQAEAESMVAHADLSTARSAWQPRLRLSARAGVESATLAGLFNAATLVGGLGASLLAPLFDGDAIRSQLSAAKSRQDEVIRLYHQAVLAAIRDVEDRLTALHGFSAQAEQQQRVVDFARTVLSMADLRYRNGATDYATVLDAQRVLLVAQDAQALIHLARYSQTLGLVRALGAGVPPAQPVAAVALSNAAKP